MVYIVNSNITTYYKTSSGNITAGAWTEDVLDLPEAKSRYIVNIYNTYGVFGQLMKRNDGMIYSSIDIDANRGVYLTGVFK